jgi:hypothetical protein
MEVGSGKWRRGPAQRIITPEENLPVKEGVYRGNRRVLGSHETGSPREFELMLVEYPFQ